MLKRSIPIVLVLVLIVVATVIQGDWSERWRPAISEEQMAELVSRFDRIPRVIGNWENQEDGQADEEQLAIAKAAGSLSRSYVNRFTGARANVFLVCGTGRNVSIHTPDKCYPAAGFTMRRQPENYVLEGLDDIAVEDVSVGECYTAPFTKEQATEGMQRLRIYWTWNGDGQWIAPGTPATAKITLSQFETIYKLYVITEIPSVDEAPGENRCVDFMRQLLPELNRSLYGDVTETDAADATAEAAGETASEEPPAA